MNENLTRREVLFGMAAAPFFQGALKSQTSSSICFMSALEMARLIRTKKLSAREALALHLKQIELVNPKVNAIVTLVAEMAQAAAAKADEMQARRQTLGPLHGLPVAHKDLLETRGIRTTFGSPLNENYIPTEDDIVVERIARAGGITIGKTNTPEFGAGSQTFNKVFGSTKNPYDLTKTCGGSSGGAAAAVASGMLPFADGGDLAASLRNPGNYCNVVGFRPTPCRVSAYPEGNVWNTLSTLGPIARTVDDCAFILSGMAGPDPRSPTTISESGDVFLKPLKRSFKKTRIAWSRDLGGLPMETSVL